MSAHSEVLEHDVSCSNSEVAVDENATDVGQVNVEPSYHQPTIDENGVATAGANFLMSLCSSNAMTLTNVDFIKESVKEMVGEVVTYLKERTCAALNHAGVEPDRNLMSDFACWKNPFLGVDTHHQLKRYMEQKHLLAEPHIVSNGMRWDLRRDCSNGEVKYKQVQVSDNFCYIPIGSTIKLVMQQKQSFDLLQYNYIDDSGDSSMDHDQVYTDWCDGENATRLKKYYDTHYGNLPNNIPVFIQVYYDDVETTNPLGSKVGIHKLGAFYFVIKNFPPAVNSSLHNIHLLALTHAADLKKYGFSPVLDTIVKELTELEKVGVQIVVDNQEYTLRCFLCQIVGDNLGVHALFGYMQNFSKATYPCDLCMMKIDDMQSDFIEKDLRTPAMYAEQIANLQSGKISKSDCGITEPCQSFNALPYFSISHNDGSDIMHDLLEGVIPLEVKLLLYTIVYTCSLLTLPEINSRLRSYDFSCNNRSKPSCITESHLKSPDGSLGQRSAQMLALFLHLPLLIADVISQIPDQNWNLYLLLRKIVEIVFAPSIVTSDIFVLNALVQEHHNLLRLVYPDRRLVYKHHRMIHYPRLIQRSGPLLRMMVMRFEAKHNFFKRLSSIICNFQNITLSLARRHQIAHCFKWSRCSPLKGAVEVGNGKMMSFSDYQLKEFVPMMAVDVDIFVASKMTAFGQEYRSGDTMLWKMDDELPVFVSLKEIVIYDDHVWLVASRYFILGFSEAVHCYDCALQSDDIVSCQLFEMMDYKPFPAVSCLKPNCTDKHIILRHKICTDSLPQC